MALTEVAVRKIAESLSPPPCEHALLLLLASLNTYSIWPDEVATEKVTEFLSEDSKIHARAEKAPTTT